MGYCFQYKSCESYMGLTTRCFFDFRLATSFLITILSHLRTMNELEIYKSDCTHVLFRLWIGKHTICSSRSGLWVTFLIALLPIPFLYYVHVHHTSVLSVQIFQWYLIWLVCLLLYYLCAGFIENDEVPEEVDHRRPHRPSFNALEEEDVEALERRVQERFYKSSHQMEYDEETTDVDQQALLPSVRDPKLWMVKCAVCS